MIIVAKNTISRLQSHAGFMKYFKNISWRLADKGVRFLTCFLVGIWVTRYLGPEKLGKFNFILSIGGLFLSFSFLGISNNVLVKEISKTKDIHKLFGSIFRLRIYGVLIMLLILALVIWAFKMERDVGIYIFLISTTAIFATTGLIPDALCTFHAKAKYIFWVWTINNIFIGTLRFTLIYYQAPFFYFVLSAFLDLSLPYIFMWIPYKKFSELKFDLWTYDWRIVKNLLSQTWPLIIMSFISIFFHKIDIILIRYFLGDANVGKFSLAATVCEYAYMLPVLVSTALFPAVVNAKKMGEEIYKKRLQRYYSLMSYLGVGVACFFTLFSKVFILEIYGEAFADTILVLKILTWESVFGFLGIAFSNYIILEGWTQKFIYRGLLGLSVNSLFNILLIPKIGIIGSAVSTLIAQFFVTYIYDLIDPQLRPQFIIKIQCLNVFSLLRVK